MNLWANVQLRRNGLDSTRTGNEVLKYARCKGYNSDRVIANDVQERLRVLSIV